MTELNIYPNPSTGTFNLNLPVSVKSYNLCVRNLLGEFVLKKQVSGITTSFDLSDYANGLYLVQVMDGNESIRTLKLIKR